MNTLTFISATLSLDMGQITSNAIFEINGNPVKHFTCNEAEFLRSVLDYGGTSSAAGLDGETLERMDYLLACELYQRFDDVGSLVAALEQGPREICSLAEATRRLLGFSAVDTEATEELRVFMCMRKTDGKISDYLLSSDFAWLASFKASFANFVRSKALAEKIALAANP